jgi:hypothetical protein
MKLYWIHRDGYPEDLWITTAESKEALFQKYSQEFKRDIEFVKENCIWEEINQVDRFRIVLEPVE